MYCSSSRLSNPCSSSGSQDNVNVYLKTGTARSQVKHVDNKRVNYQVHTAVAVASCRGTEWIIDDSNNVDCFEGVVAVSAYKPVQLVENADTGIKPLSPFLISSPVILL